MSIAVIGMDRSGSSLAMRMLAAVGVDIGSDADHVAPHPDDNPHGYQELRSLIEINGQLLDTLEADPLDVELGAGIDWDDVRFEDLRAQARALVGSFNGEPWAIKEPRMSLFVPFWRHVLPDLKFVICLRDPAAVIRSQERRESNYEDRERLLRKWLRYTVASLDSTEGAERIVVDFDDALSRPREAANRYAVLAGTPAPSDQALQAVEALVDPALTARQAKASASEQIDLPPEIEAAYLMIRLSIGDETALRSATAAAAGLEHALIERTGAEWRHAATVGMYERSLSWRITAPLRAIGARRRHK